MNITALIATSTIAYFYVYQLGVEAGSYGKVACMTDYECETGERQVLPEDGCDAPPHTEDLGSPEIPRLVPAPRETILEA